MLGYLLKIALSQDKGDAALAKIDNARPYAEKRALAGAGGGIWAGQMIEKLRKPAASGNPRKGLPLGLALLGVSMGVGQEMLRRMAQQAHYRTILKQTRTQEGKIASGIREHGGATMSNETVRCIYVPVEGALEDLFLPVEDDTLCVKGKLGDDPHVLLMPDHVVFMFPGNGEVNRRIPMVHAVGPIIITRLDSTASPVSLTEEQAKFYKLAAQQSSAAPVDLGPDREVMVADVVVTYRKAAGQVAQQSASAVPT